MISFKTFIKENNERETEKQTMLDNIVKRCEELGDNFLLYRGVTENTSYNYFGQTISRTDRKPRDSSRFLHNLLDELFEKKFGIKARSNSTFVSYNKGMAGEYTGNDGDIYIIIPIKCTFINSNKIDDLFLFTEDPPQRIADKLQIKYNLDRIDRLTFGTLLQIVASPAGYANTVYKDVLKNLEEFKNFTEIALDKIMDSYKKYTLLDKFGDNEVMMSGTFYYIKADRFSRALKYSDLAILIKEKEKNVLES